LNGSGRDIMEILSQQILRGTEEKNEKPQ
jgi:hypothetical protein